MPRDRVVIPKYNIQVAEIGHLKVEFIKVADLLNLLYMAQLHERQHPVAAQAFRLLAQAIENK